MIKNVPGLTIRQLGYWCSQGWLGEYLANSGTGNNRDFTVSQQDQINFALTLINSIEMSPKMALKIGGWLVKNYPMTTRIEIGNIEIMFNTPLEEETTDDNTEEKAS